MPAVANGLLPPVLRGFLASNPTLQVSLQVHGRRDVEHWIAGKQFDLGLAALPIDHPAVECEKFVEVGLVAAVPPTSRFARRRTLTLSDLAEETFIMLPTHTLFRMQIEDAFMAQGLRPRVRVETSSMASACEMVAEGIGVTTVDPFTARSFLPGRIAVRELKPRLERVYGFLYPTDRPVSVLARRFTELVREVAPRVLGTMPKLQPAAE